MRDASIVNVDTWNTFSSAPQAAANNQVAAIADIWQFWLDAAMTISLILPPSGASFDMFPCGESAIGRPLFEVIDLESNVTNAVELYNRFRAQEKFHNVKFSLGGVGAPARVVLISGTPVFNTSGEWQGYRCTVADVTAATGAANDIREYEAILAAFIRHVPNLVVVKDVEGRYMALNPLAERTYGVPRGRLIGRQAADALSPEIAAECVKEDLEVLESEEVRETQQTFPAPDGARVFRSVKFPIFDADRSLVGTGTIGVDITEFRNAEDRLYQRANFDTVTGLPNRHLLHDRLDNVIALARRAETKVGVIALDVGDFTSINEAIGHVASDWLLTDVATALRQLCRETDTVARLDGDVFAIILPSLKQPEELDAIAEKILKALKEPRMVGEDQVFIQPSIGTALFPADSQHGKELVHYAKMALDHAKEGGRGQAARFRPAITDAFARRMKIESHLRQAIECDELFLVYQPIVDMASGGVVGAEALLRWTNSDLGVVPPDEFIPVAEATGLIGAIGEWVLERATQDAKRMNSDGVSVPVTVNVNMSVKQLADSTLTQTIARILAKHELGASHLRLEMTETAFAGDTAIFQAALEGLRTLGLTIALDDFGTGYSSLSYLHRFRFHQLKIDKSFIDNISSDNDGFLLVENIIRMAHSLRLEVVAEGVETAEQVLRLHTLKCDKIQGYFISRPLPLPDFEKLYQEINGVEIPAAA
jgi:diguanylate cyclase (GGDEF)-like protein/PAS domain S-box-containing protein